MEEAFRAYTLTNAWSMFMERQIGRLGPGLKADLVVLDRDLRKIPAESIDEATVRLTVVGGKVVYRR